MWFLNSLPENVSTRFIVEAFGKAYQRTSIEIFVSSSPEKENVEANTVVDESVEKNVEKKEVRGPKTHLIVVPFPWSANKDLGSIKFEDVNILGKLSDEIENEAQREVQQMNDIVNLTEKDVTVYENVKKIKKETDSKYHDYPTINELWNVYAEEDYGVFVAEIKENTIYRLQYTHKISILSSLFTQTRFSNLHLYKANKKFTTDIWAINTRKDKLSKSLTSVSVSQGIRKMFNDLSGETVSVDRYNFNDKNDWSEDLRFSTTCWDSSDEEDCSDDDDERSE